MLRADDAALRRGLVVHDLIDALRERSGGRRVRVTGAVEDRLRDAPAGQRPTREELNQAGSMMLDKLIDRLGKIDNPTVPLKPSKYALKVPKRASKAHVGE